ncbi:MAG: hypothetical protein AAFU79_01745 [Myxococcota bacterium]
MLSLDDGPTVEWVELATASAEPRVTVDALHDGDHFGGPGPLAARPEVRAACEARRASGTAGFARVLAASLEQDGFLLGRRARGTLDLDAPAGVDPVGQARALGAPLAPLLSPELRRRLVAEHRVALVTMAEARVGARVALSVHGSPSSKLRLRAEVESAAPSLDTLVPSEVLGRSADPFLVAALHAAVEGVIDLEAEPPPLPGSSLLARALAFAWLRFLRDELQDRSAPHASATRRLWSGLLDTSELSADTAAVKAFLFEGREPPPEDRPLFEQMARLRREIDDWASNRKSELVEKWFRSPELQHLLVIEVPLTWSDDDRRKVAHRLAGGLRAWWSESRAES